MRAKKWFIGVVAAMGSSMLALSASAQVSIPTELEPVALAGSLLTTHKTTIVALIGFGIALGFIGTVVAMIKRALGGRKKVLK